MANPCEYYIGKKKFNEEELKAYLAKGGLDRFIDENAIDLSKFKYEAAPKEEGAKILPISEPPTKAPTEVNIPEGADENYIKMANVVNDAFVENKFGLEALDQITSKLEDTNLENVIQRIKLNTICCS